MTTTTIPIEGMHCGGCVRSVTNALKQIQGVTNADVSLSEERAIVTYDEITVAFADLRKSVEEAGYSVPEFVNG